MRQRRILPGCAYHPDRGVPNMAAAKPPRPRLRRKNLPAGWAGWPAAIAYGSGASECVDGFVIYDGAAAPEIRTGYSTEVAASPLAGNIDVLKHKVPPVGMWPANPPAGCSFWRENSCKWSDRGT